MLCSVRTISNKKATQTASQASAVLFFSLNETAVFEDAIG